MIKVFLWIFIVQMLLNPFTVFIVLGVVAGVNSLVGVFALFCTVVIYFYIWQSVRLRNRELDDKAMKVWVK